ncbi:MAG: glycoside hydrolase family 97 N-terminal domain-containing protein, partial [Flavisolibacter sp.]
MLRLVISFYFSFFIVLCASSQAITVQSPNQHIKAELFCKQNGGIGEWYIKASYNNNGKITEAIPRIDLGLTRSDQDFSKGLKFLKGSKPVLRTEAYTALHGKKSVCTNAANDVVVSF